MVDSLKQKFLYICTLSFFTGIVFSSIVKTDILNIFIVYLVSIILLSFCVLNNFLNKIILKVSLGVLFFIFGFVSFYIKDISQNTNALDVFLEKNITIEGNIISEVEHRNSSQRIILKADKLFFDNQTYSIDQKILVSTDLFPRFYYGDIVNVSGKIQKPENFITENGKEFDYINYLKKDSIFYMVSFAGVEKIDYKPASYVKSNILKIKQLFINSINLNIPAPESSLLSGILLGVKESLPEKLENAFINTGLVHIIVLSGYNVTIIAESVIRLLSFVSVSLSLYLGIVFIFLFSVMTGGGATIIRASIMAAIALLARISGRAYFVKRALIIAAFLMVLQNPYILVYDISFQLSFLATVGLIYLTPIFEKYFKFVPNFINLKEILSSTIAVQLFVLPFILYKIGNFSVVAPITNVLVLPLIPATMFFGFITGLFGIISNVLSAPVGLITYFLLKLEIFIVEFFNKISFANLSISRFPLFLVLLLYVIIFYFVFIKNDKKD